jgi:hypothetical protein
MKGGKTWTTMRRCRQGQDVYPIRPHQSQGKSEHCGKVKLDSEHSFRTMTESKNSRKAPPFRDSTGRLFLRL